MSDPQQSPVPPYASTAGPPPQQPAHHYYQGGAPQPQYAQPSQPQPQYAQPQYGQPVYTPAASGPTSSNTPGRIGFIIGLVGLAISLLSSVIIQIMIRSADYALIGLVSGALSVIAFVASLAALIFGIVGLRRPGAPHGLAGIATGIGGAGAVGGGFAFIVNAIGSVFYF